MKCEGVLKFSLRAVTQVVAIHSTPSSVTLSSNPTADKAFVYIAQKYNNNKNIGKRDENSVFPYT